MKTEMQFAPLSDWGGEAQQEVRIRHLGFQQEAHSFIHEAFQFWANAGNAKVSWACPVSQKSSPPGGEAPQVIPRQRALGIQRKEPLTLPLVSHRAGDPKLGLEG